MPWKKDAEWRGRGSWRKAGWAPGFKGKLGSPELHLVGGCGSLALWLWAKRGRDFIA